MSLRGHTLRGVGCTFRRPLLPLQNLPTRIRKPVRGFHRFSERELPLYARETEDISVIPNCAARFLWPLRHAASYGTRARQWSGRYLGWQPGPSGARATAGSLGLGIRGAVAHNRRRAAAQTYYGRSDGRGRLGSRWKAWEAERRRSVGRANGQPQTLSACGGASQSAGRQSVVQHSSLPLGLFEVN